MSEQEFVTPEQKHKYAEWKCPECGDDGTWQRTEWWPVPAPDRIPPGYDWFYAELYWCSQCNEGFIGHSHRASSPPLEDLQ